MFRYYSNSLTKTSWWFFTNPSEKYAQKGEHFPNFAGWKFQKHPKTVPPRNRCPVLDLGLWRNLDWTSWWCCVMSMPLEQKAPRWRLKPSLREFVGDSVAEMWGIHYIPWAPKTIKNKGFDQLKTRLFTMKIVNKNWMLFILSRKMHVSFSRKVRIDIHLNWNSSFQLQRLLDVMIHD